MKRKKKMTVWVSEWTPIWRGSCAQFVRRVVDVPDAPEVRAAAWRLGATIDKRFEEARATK